MMDVTQRLERHVECCQKRDAAARRAIKLLAQGKYDDGNAAAEEAELWALRAKALEPPTNRIS